MSSDRRSFLFTTAIASGSWMVGCTTTTPQSNQRPLAPGQFEWYPQRSPSGPLLVVVSIDDQVAYVYRNGVQIARSTVSTGRPGKETPTGVFTILQRKVDHESNIYVGAEMPYMQRLTWTGIAMHAGELPGYPASGGCIRLPYEFSKLVYSIMQNGSTVVITKRGSTPSTSHKPEDILMASRARSTTDAAIPRGREMWAPQRSSSGPFSILLSYGDRTVYVWRNGVQIGQAPIGIAPGSNPPEGVFLMLEGQAPSDPRFPGLKMHPWSVLSLSGGSPRGNAVEVLRSQIFLSDDFRRKVNPILTPGTILLATHESSSASTRSDPGFTIMTPQPQA